jgi:O-antigen/teichoic acid export membrane protein
MTDRASLTLLRRRVRVGTAWSTLDVAVNRGAGFALGLVVARLLAPRDFGVFAVALVVHAILINISDLGIGTALIRYSESDVKASARTAVTLALLNAVALGAVMAVTAPWLARMLGAPTATETIRVMALTLPLAGLAAVPSALLRREFRMQRVFIADTANTVASAAVVIPLALSAEGPLALAFSFVAGQLLTTILMILFSPARHLPGWNSAWARRLLHFGGPLVVANTLSFSIQNVDYIVVGRLMGSVDLGYYVLAFNICGWPQNIFSAVIRSVSLPAFSRLLEDGHTMGAVFSATLNRVAKLTLPICLLLGALAHPLVALVYGHKWAPASQALVGLAILGAARTLIELMSDFLVALGRTKAVMVVQLLWLAALTGALIVLVDAAGIAGAGAAQAGVAVLVVIPAYAYFLRRAHAEILSALPPAGWALLASCVAGVVATRVASSVLACSAGLTVAVAIYLIPYGSELLGLVRSFPLPRRAHSPSVPGAAESGL